MDDVWTAEKFRHAKTVHMIGPPGAQSIILETTEALIDISDLAFSDDGFRAQIKIYSRFHERIELAATDPGGQRPGGRWTG